MVTTAVDKLKHELYALMDNGAPYAEIVRKSQVSTQLKTMTVKEFESMKASAISAAAAKQQRG